MPIFPANIDPHNAYTFSGKEFDQETGLMYYGARYLDPWSGTWNTQDILRGQIQIPETLHRYAFVKNNPVNYGDPDGMLFKQYGPLGEYADKYLENKIIDPYLESYSAAHTFDTSFSSPEIPLKTIANVVAPNLSPYVNNIPPASVNLSNELDLDFNFTDEGFTFTGSDTFAGGAVTPNNNYGVGASGDVGVISDNQGFYTGAGGTINVQKNGKIIVDKAGFVGDREVLPLFGANSAQDYKNKKHVVLNQKVIESIGKAKDERVQRQKAYRAYIERLRGCLQSN